MSFIMSSTGKNHLVSWLEAQGVDGADVDSSIKLRKFWESLNRFVHSRPGITESVEFKYGHLFSDWQKFGFCTTMIYEIGRLGCLVSLETLSHSSTSSVTADLVNELQPLAERRMKGGTRYQNQLAIHYLLRALNANENNTKKAKFASFLTGFSENTLRQNWSNIHRKSDEKDIGWENDLRAVRAHCVDLGLTGVVNLIDADLGSQNE